MVKAIGTSIHNDILIEVNKAKFYSVIADEVTDIANKEELSLSLCYILDDVIVMSYLMMSLTVHRIYLVVGHLFKRKHHWQCISIVQLIS